MRNTLSLISTCKSERTCFIICQLRAEWECFCSINVAVTNLSTDKPPPSLLETWSAHPNPRERALQELDPDFIMSLPKALRSEILASKGLKLADVKQLLQEKKGNEEEIGGKKKKTGYTMTQAIEIDLEDSPSSIVMLLTPSRASPPILASPTPREILHREDSGESDGDRSDTPMNSSSGDEDDFPNDNIYYDEIDGHVDLLDEPSGEEICYECGMRVLAFAKPAHARWHDEAEYV